MILNNNDLIILEDYLFDLMNGKKWYHKKGILNYMQMERLDYFFDMAILFCKTKKVRKHKKSAWRYNTDLLATKEQLQVYKPLLDYINSVISKANTDNKLSSKCKKKLSSYLALIQCHLMGKCNSKYKK